MVYGSWDMKCTKQNSFFTLGYPPNSLKNKISKKNQKKCLEIPSFYTSVPKVMIICYTVHEIWHVMDVNVIFHFGLYFSLYHPNSPKNENFKKMKKTPGDIIILHNCTKNHDHMLYCSWDMACGRCNCYFLSSISCPFTTKQPKKLNFKKMKKAPRNIIILHNCTKNHDHMIICYAVPDIRCVTDVIVIFHFGLLFALPQVTTRKIKISKKWKNRLEISSYYTCVPKIMIWWCTVPQIWCLTDSDILRWVPHLKSE